MKKFYTLAMLVPLALAANARQLTPQEAMARVSENSSVKAVRVAPTTKDIKPAMTVRKAGLTSLYVFNNGGDGYMVVSADDCAMPLLGYSDSGTFDTANIPPQMQWWLDFYASEISYAANHGAQPAKVSSRADYKAIEPMLTTQWNQDAPYNDDCPMDGSSRSVTGCVATAMAQAMKYHNWPEKGTGSNSYTNNGQTISLDFSTVTFDWNDMLNTYDSSATAAQKAAVAELMYACGVSVNMTYTSSESGAVSLNIAPALYNYFGYSGAMTQPQRAFYGADEWNDLVYNQLAAGMPVLYGGQSNAGGHQFVCDGYSSGGYFHFNWGWSGMSDGYYLLSALDPTSQGIGGSTTGFNYDQSIVINMVPSTNTTVSASPLIYCYGSFGVSEQTTQLGESATFTSTEGYYNFGCKKETGYLGVKITGANGTKYLEHENEMEINPTAGFYDYSVTLPSDLAAGTYTVTPAYKDAASGTWYDILAPLSGVRSLTMTVANGTATFADAVAPSLSFSNFDMGTELYLGTNFKSTFTIENTGNDEFYGQLMFGLLDNAGNLVAESSSAVAVDLTAGESTDVEYISMFPTEVQTSQGYETVSPGTYTLVVFDYVSNGVLYEYPQQVTVGTAPTSTTLDVTSFGLVDGGANNVVTDPTAIKFTGTVECTQGYYANQLKVAIFPEGASSTSIVGSTDYLFINSGDQANFTATINLSSASNGDVYYAVVYNANNTQLSNALQFTVSIDENAAGVDNAVVNDGGEARYYNLQGVEISADNLTPGVYLTRQGTQVSKIVIR